MLSNYWKYDIRMFAHVKTGDYIVYCIYPLLHNSSLDWDSSGSWVTAVPTRLHHSDLLSSHPSSKIPAISGCVLSLIPLSSHLSSVSACFSLWGLSEETAAYGRVINKRLWLRGAQTWDKKSQIPLSLLSSFKRTLTTVFPWMMLRRIF